MFYLLWILTAITCLCCIAYAGMIAFFSYGWMKTKHLKTPSSRKVRVAVIVAARNEENNIASCLEALMAQSYPAEKTEIIIVNDHSEDNTSAIVRKYIREGGNIQLLDTEEKGKKAAIAKAIKNTSAELIITTDADCIMAEKWIETIVSFYEHSKAVMIVGPVAFHNEGSLFEKMQSLELMALLGSTGGALYFDKAIMCNGANLAYTRQIFNELEGFKGIDQGASGDDVLLMYKVSRRYKNKIKFLKDQDAIVSTSAKATLKEFTEQRKRWSSKGFGAFNAETKYVSLIVYMFSALIILTGILSGFSSVKSGICLSFFRICLILMGIKCVFDFLLLFLAASFYNKKRYLYLFLPLQFIYILYVVIIGLLGSSKKYEWKGRKF